MMNIFLWSYNYHKNKSTKTEPIQKAGKRDGLISCDAKHRLADKDSLEFVKESVISLTLTTMLVS
jgi:hypothetical protein